jgi:hypothetical protein
VHSSECQFSQSASLMNIIGQWLAYFLRRGLELSN